MLPLSKEAAYGRMVMTDLRLAVDLADYTAVPTASQVAMLKAIGVKKAIVGTSYPRQPDPNYVATAQIAALEAGGIPCEEYQFPGAYLSPVRPWWTDAETIGATQTALRQAASDGAEGVYTRRFWWLTNTQNWDIKSEFPNLRLWTAQYVHGANDPCLIEASGGTKESIAQEFIMLGAFVPYAGFSAPDMVQWHDSVTVCGLNVDLNHIVGEERIVYTDQQIDEKLTAIVQKLGEIQTNVANTFGLAVRIQTRVDALEAAQPKPPLP